jgi:ABC-2 type transport system permease protein
MYYVNNPEVSTVFNQQLEGEEVEELRKEYAEDPKYSAEGVFDIYYFYSKLTQGGQGYVIAFFIALFAVIFVGSENSTGFIKNIAGQPSIRHRTILSKCLSILMFSGMALMITFVVALICSQLLYGYIHFGLYSTYDRIVFALTQLLLNAALGIVIMCFSELIKNQAISMAIGAMLSIGIARLITENLDDFFALNNFSFSNLLITINKATLPLPFSSKAYQLAWKVGGGFIVLAVAISIFSMKKRDI